MNKNNRNIDVDINCRQGKCVDNLQKHKGKCLGIS